MFNLIPSRDIESLCNAIKQNDKSAIKKLLLNEDLDVNASNSRGNTPLNWLITRFEDLEIMTMLLDRGADIHVKNHRNYTPLDVAVENKKMIAAELLIKRGALIGEDLNAVLVKAIKVNNHILVKMIIENGMQYNPSINLKESLRAALSRKNIKIIECIAPFCQSMNPSDKYIPKTYVIEPGYKNHVELLLKWNFTIKPRRSRDSDFIYAAVEYGYLPIVLQLLKIGIDVNMINSDTGLSLLKVACLNKHHKIVENLLKHKARLNIRTRINIEILNKYYYKDPYEDVFSSLYTEKDLQYLTCLHIAVINSDVNTTKLLLSNGAVIRDDPTYFKITSVAVRRNCEEIARIFLDRIVNVNSVNPNGESLIQLCVNPDDKRDFKYNIAKMLLKKGATFHIQTPGNNLTFEAIINTHYKIAQLFLDYNANIQYVNSDGDTLLHKAIELGFDVKFIKTLLKLNAPVDAMNNNLLTPLLIACKTKSKDQLEIIKALLHSNANVNYAIDNENIMGINNVSISPSSLENLPESDDDLSLLIEEGIQFNDVYQCGQTALHIACKYSNNMTVKIIELLLKHNANIDATDKMGQTPLFIACKYSNDTVVKYLLDNNANVNHNDMDHLTPLFMAVQNPKYNSKIIAILLERKANVHCVDRHGNSIIHAIVENSHVELLKSFIHTQVNFNSVNDEGYSPLYNAIQIGCFNMIKMLIKYGADINFLDEQDQTPFRIALTEVVTLRHKLSEYRYHRNIYWSRRFLRRHLFRENYCAYSCFSELNSYKEIIKVLKTHIVKLKTAGLMVKMQNLNIVYYPEIFSEVSDRDQIDCVINVLQIEEECKREIEKMKTEYIRVNGMTFYDLLTKSIHFLTRLVKNKNLQQMLNRSAYDKKYPLYIDIVRSRFRDARLRLNLLNPAKKYFESNVSSFLPFHCVDTVFNYFNIAEIKTFTTSMKSSDE